MDNILEENKDESKLTTLFMCSSQERFYKTFILSVWF